MTIASIIHRICRAMRRPVLTRQQYRAWHINRVTRIRMGLAPDQE